MAKFLRMHGEQIIGWHLRNAGSGGSKADAPHHALRMFREVIEFCLASGCSQNDLVQTFTDESFKEKSKGNNMLGFVPDIEQLRDATRELCDVLALAEIWNYYYGHNINVRMDELMLRLAQRKWIPDEHGVLWRIGSEKGNALFKAKHGFEPTPEV